MPLFVVFWLKQGGSSGVVRHICPNTIRLFSVRHNENRSGDKYNFQCLEGCMRPVRPIPLLILFDKIEQRLSNLGKVFNELTIKLFKIQEQLHILNMPRN